MEEIEKLKIRISDLEQKNVEQANCLEELQDFIDNAALPLHWVNGSGIIVWANVAEMNLLGYERKEYINQHFSKFHADQDIAEDISTRLLKHETLINYSAPLLSKSGGIKYVLINTNVYCKNQEFIHTRCCTLDLTEIRQKDEEKTVLIAELWAKVNRLQ